MEKLCEQFKIKKECFFKKITASISVIISQTFRLKFILSSVYNKTTEAYTDDSISFYHKICKIITNVLAIIFLLKLCSKTHLNAPNFFLF